MTRLNPQWVAYHWRDCTSLPAPGETWQVSDVDDIPWTNGQTLRHKGVIDRVERSKYGQAATYETNPDAWERIQHYIDANDGGVPGDA